MRILTNRQHMIAIKFLAQVRDNIIICKNKFIIVQIIVLLVNISCVKRIEKEKFYLPNNYIGRIYVVFDQKNGMPEKYENGCRVYEIPSSGILLTQFQVNTGAQTSSNMTKYYYLSNEKIVKEIHPLFGPTRELNIKSDSIVVYRLGNGLNTINNEGKSERYEYFLSVIDTFKNLKNISIEDTSFFKIVKEMSTNN